MKIQKRHIVLAALILALSAAVFINWRFQGADNKIIKPTSKELGVATYVNSDITSTDDEVMGVSKTTKNSDSYFAKAIVERQQFHDKAIDLAQETLTLSDSSDEARAKAVEQLNKLEETFVKEGNIEGIIKAKGFSECLCYISDDSCTVTVLKNELKDNAAFVIKDAVLSQLDIGFDKIKIIEV